MVQVERAGLVDKLDAARAHLKSKAEVIDAHVAEIKWLTSQLEQTQACRCHLARVCCGHACPACRTHAMDL